MLSVPQRAAQVALIGIRPQFLRFWQTATLVEIMFHPAHPRLPRGVERRLDRLFVTPRLHAIPHATVREETPPPSRQSRIEDLSGGGR